MGALASQLWFIAFALSPAAPVRTLALIEAPMAQVVSLKMFCEPPSLREGLGMSLIVIAVGILVWTARRGAPSPRIARSRAVCSSARERAFSEG